jgi:Mg2+-importing ATPase
LATPSPAASAAFWSRDAGELAAALASGPTGLSGAEAARRLHPEARERIAGKPVRTALRLLARQFRSPLVLILVFAAAVSSVLGNWTEAAIILAIVLASTLLGFAQEYRADVAVAALRRRLALSVRVLRDGVEQAVPAPGIVPGDVVLLSAGNLVPGDGLVLEARDFLVTEASLTGESFPVEKQPGVLPPGTPLAQRTNCVFLGTSVRSGSARALVVHTGRETAYGAVAARLAVPPPESDFTRGVHRFGGMLMRVMIFIVLFVLIVNGLLGRAPLDSLLFAVALAVGLTPELLPAIVSVTLARGAREMARRGVMVRRLDAIEDLGGMDVLCTDKTGTLTAGVVALDAALDPEGRPDAEVRRLAFLNAALETGIDNPLDAALVAAGAKQGLSTAGVRKVDEIPYDFIRKRLTLVLDDGDPAGHLIVTKGAFATVLAVCAVEGDVRERCEALYREKSLQGFRVLAVAARRCAPRERYTREDETGMRLAGLLLFFDPPNPDAARTVADLAALGVAVKVITGDNRYVAGHAARAIGLDASTLLTGEDIAGLRDESLWHLAERSALFVEVDPQQKERIVRALQHTGHAVGFLGDGINDAPALHAADVGISVDGAVDVARESADVVLLRHDLDVLRRGVVDGRATFANTLKYIGITTSANFGNMVSMALATPLLPFLPLAAKQILLNNFLSDLPAIAISTDRVDAEPLQRAQRWNVAEIRRFMLVFGLLSTVFDLISFALLLRVFHADEATFQTAWFLISLLTELAVLLVLRTRGPAWRSAPGRLLLWATLIVGAAALALPHTGGLAALFGFVPLGAPLFAVALLIVAGYVAATEAAKRHFYAAARSASR